MSKRGDLSFRLKFAVGGEMQMNRVLRWKCLDDFPKMNKNQLFYGEEFVVPAYMHNALGPVLKNFRNKFLDEVEKIFSESKDSLIVAGGTYTFFFVLPKIFQIVKKKYPLLPVRIRLEEVRDVARLSLSNADIVLGAHYLGLQDDISSDSAMKDTQYFASREYFDDEIFFAASDESVEKFGSAEEAMRSHEVLFGRLQDDVSFIRYLYQFKPMINIHEKPRIVIDSYFAAYFLMTQSLGLWHVWSSSESGSVVKLGQPFAMARRRVFLRRDETNVNRYCVRQIYKVLRRKI